ncbi:MAG: hypothetical protein H6710_06400 [Myxococcales bacterium]|nr:hypothetical protein [Myxococcales bacterium]
MAARRARAMPVIERLFSRYADVIGAAALGRGTREDALPYFEGATYLVLWTSYETDDLARFDPMVTPQMHEAARLLGVTYRPPRERGVALSWATIEALLGAPPPKP